MQYLYFFFDFRKLIYFFLNFFFLRMLKLFFIFILAFICSFKIFYLHLKCFSIYKIIFLEQHFHLHLYCFILTSFSFGFLKISGTFPCPKFSISLLRAIPFGSILFNFSVIFDICFSVKTVDKELTSFSFLNGLDSTNLGTRTSENK